MKLYGTVLVPKKWYSIIMVLLMVLYCIITLKILSWIIMFRLSPLNTTCILCYFDTYFIKHINSSKLHCHFLDQGLYYWYEDFHISTASWWQLIFWAKQDCLIVLQDLYTWTPLTPLKSIIIRSSGYLIRRSSSMNGLTH